MIFDLPTPAPVVQATPDIPRHRGSGRKEGDDRMPRIINAVPYPYTDGVRLMAWAIKEEWSEEDQEMVSDTIILDVLIGKGMSMERVIARECPGYQYQGSWIPRDGAPF